MSLERLKTARKKSIGTKQTAKAMEKGSAKMVFVAKDAEEHITREIVKLAQAKGAELVHVDSMMALGKACGIEVGAAVAAILDA
ncbi:MAG TPA: ribosomal L7Ae/L30e/S12e/Gadd45 family protein [Symbiobacteriaceae bacterium]|nr:ribosomal L7Ae/L30e/S12e/Gadd45 family protein [Symbiobacteriaceae bacterium]